MPESSKPSLHDNLMGALNLGHTPTFIEEYSPEIKKNLLKIIDNDSLDAAREVISNLSEEEHQKIYRAIDELTRTIERQLKTEKANYESSNGLLTTPRHLEKLQEMGQVAEQEEKRDSAEAAIERIKPLLEKMQQIDRLFAGE